MTLRRIWLVVTGLLFFAWIGWLAFLAATTTHPIILSRPQFLVSALDVIAHVEDVNGKPNESVRILLVHFPDSQKSLAGQTIRVVNLPRTRERGWSGAGDYIIPLDRSGQDYRVTAVPASPGFEARNDVRIYTDKEETRRQLDSIRKYDLPEAPAR